MLRRPHKCLQAINNCVTVALPLTSIDIDEIIKVVKKAIENEFISATALADMEDIDFDTFGLKDGSVLVWNESIEKWQSTTTLAKQVVDGGDF